MSALVAVHAAATWFMVGLIWVIQAVHYPLFHRVGAAAFADYEAAHTTRMGRLLLVPAGVEVVTAGLLPWLRPDRLALWLTLVAGALLAAVWVATALVAVPEHRRLGGAYRPEAVDRLVASNWFRTGAWSARGVLATVMVLAGAG